MTKPKTKSIGVVKAWTTIRKDLEFGDWSFSYNLYETRKLAQFCKDSDEKIIPVIITPAKKQRERK